MIAGIIALTTLTGKLMHDFGTYVTIVKTAPATLNRYHVEVAWLTGSLRSLAAILKRLKRIDENYKFLSENGIRFHLLI